MATIAAPDTCKAVVQDAAVQVPVDHLLHIRSEEAILLGEMIIVDLFKSLKMVLNTAVILGILWLSRAIYSRDVGHDRFSSGSES
jgi:hypothetical protein